MSPADWPPIIQAIAGGVVLTGGALVNGTVPPTWTSGDSLVVTALCETS